MSSLSRRVVKAMGVFGGVQIVSILCSIVRTKLVAVWIGTVGMGLFGVFNSAVDLISQITMLGVGSSGTRDVARSENTEHRRRTVTAVRRWTLWLGVAGAIVTFLIAPLLSQWSFGDTEHTTSFRWLSITVLMMSITGGHTAVLQGLSRFSSVARAGLWGAVAATVVAIPLFFYLRIHSIVPVIITTSIAMFIFTWRNRECEITPVKEMSMRETLAAGKSLITLGFYITASTVVTLAASYILMAWFNSRHGSDTAGLYQAGFTLINRYVGLVFTAIAMEYFPRLAGVATRRRISEVFVSHETMLSLAVLVPVLSLFAIFAPLITRLLYSSEFEAIVPFISIACVGTVFRAVSWCMAFTMLVKGDGRIYLLTETLSGIFYILLNILAYSLLGIAGMGYAYTLWYLIYAVIVGIVYRCRYGMRLSRGIGWLICLSVTAVTIVVAVLLAPTGLPAIASVAIATIITIISSTFSLRLLRKTLRR